MFLWFLHIFLQLHSNIFLCSFSLNPQSLASSRILGAFLLLYSQFSLVSSSSRSPFKYFLSHSSFFSRVPPPRLTVDSCFGSPNLQPALHKDPALYIQPLCYLDNLHIFPELFFQISPSVGQALCSVDQWRQATTTYNPCTFIHSCLWCFLALDHPAHTFFQRTIH